MERAEAFQKVAEALGNAEKSASAKWEESGVAIHAQEIISWLDIADRWLQLGLQLPTQTPPAPPVPPVTIPDAVVSRATAARRRL